MPKRLKNRPKRPSDPILAAQELLRETEAIGEDLATPVKEAPVVDFKAHLSAYMSKLGKKGGKISGAKRIENLSPEKRRAIASQAARRRWERVARTKATKKR